MQVGPASGYADACIQCNLLQPEESQSQEITLNAFISIARCCAYLHTYNNKMMYIIIIDLLKYQPLAKELNISYFILQNYIHTIPFSIFLGAT